MLLSDSTGNVFLASARTAVQEATPGGYLINEGESGFSAPSGQAMAQSVFCTPPLRLKA